MKIKPGKLYVKIFLFFLAFLVITEFAIFGFFMLFAGREYRSYYERYNEARLTLSRELLMTALQTASNPEGVNSPALTEQVRQLGLALKIRIWLTTADGRIVAQSFEGEIPNMLIEKYKAHIAAYEKNRYKFSHRRYFKAYMTDGIQLADGSRLTLHILFGGPPPIGDVGLKFAAGLLGIGVIIALLVIPVSRHISQPIKILTTSTRRFGEGDLTQRASVKSRDEIGELGSAFNKMADRLEEMVHGGKELTAQVSHELRSPLTRIQLAVELIKDRIPLQNDPSLMEHLLEIQDDVEDLDRLIGRILELSKLDLNTSAPGTDRFPIAGVIEAVFRRFHPVIESKRLDVELDLAADCEIIGCQEEWVTALSNLVDNACKFSPVGGRIVACSQHEAGQTKIHLTNPCPALTTDELKRIFDPFYRLDPEAAHDGGLGLAITRKIIEKHGGTIVAENSAGGVTLSITLSVPFDSKSAGAGV